jgi:hypothetical protein
VPCPSEFLRWRAWAASSRPRPARRLLAIVMVLEISQNYSLMPALMLGTAISTLVSRGLHANSIYTEPLKLRSLEVESYRVGAATEQTIGDLMRAPVTPLRENTTLPEIADRFLSSPTITCRWWMSNFGCSVWWPCRI